MYTSFQRAFSGQAPLPALNKVEILETFYDGQSLPAHEENTKQSVSNDDNSLLSALTTVRERIVMDHGGLLGRSFFHKESRKELSGAIRQIVLEKKIKVEGKEIDELVSTLEDEICGLGPIESFMKDNSITEVMINGPFEVFVERKGIQERTAVRFHDEEHLLSIARKMLNLAGAVVNTAQPIVDARLPDCRINVVIPPVARNGTTITIRKYPPITLSEASMIDTGVATQEMFDLLKLLVKGGANLFVGGATGSGKTTLIKLLYGYVPDHERSLSIEDTEELRLKTLYPEKHIVPLECRFTEKEETNIDMARLLKSALRMYPYRIIVGEVRGPEAYIMIEAMNTGHDGSMTSGHAKNARESLRRLVQMILRAGLQLSSEMIYEMVCSSINIVLFQRKMPDGKRRITEIVEVRGFERGKPVLQPLFRYRVNGGHQRVENAFLSLELAESLVARGISRDELAPWVRKEDLDRL